jgi:hypothetical protein
MPRFTALPVVFCLALSAAGCGSGSSVQYNETVEGTVKLDDQPLGGVLVMFVPENESFAQVSGSSGLTDDSGHYTLKCDNGRSGAAVGKHRIVLTRGPGANTGRDNDPNNNRRKDGTPAATSDKRPVPPIYSVAASPKLFLTVTADQHSGYDLSIKSAEK